MTEMQGGAVLSLHTGGDGDTGDTGQTVDTGEDFLPLLEIFTNYGKTRKDIFVFIL